MKLPSLVLLLVAPLAAQAGDGVQAALQAAKTAWPAATITALSPAAPCTGEAVSDAPAGARNGIAQLRVRCSGAPSWTRYIALRIEQHTQVAVLRAPLAQGQALTAEQIDWQTRDALQLPADAITPSTLPAAVSARRGLAAGSVLTLGSLTAPKAIERGQAVTLISRAAGMEVRAPGEALADALLGTRVQVRNKNSRRVVEGIASGNGTVEVAL